MSGIDGLGRMMRPSSSSASPVSAQQPEVAALVVDHAAPVSPYPAIADPFKRRGALREYFRGLRGENKENEGVDMDGNGNGKLALSSSSPGLPKQKTLGLCRRHVVPSAVAGAGAGGQRDKRKFNAPRQTPEKRQKPDESEGSPGADVPRRLDVGNGTSVSEDVSYSSGGVQLAASCEHVESETSMMGQGVGSMEEDGLNRRLEMVFSGAKEVSASINRLVQDSPSFSFKREAQEPPKTPTMRKALMPLHSNRQAILVRTSPVSHLPMQPNFSGGMEREGRSGSSESLFQLASGKKYQPSAAAKARAALMFESDAELADFLDFE